MIRAIDTDPASREICHPSLATSALHERVIEHAFSFAKWDYHPIFDCLEDRWSFHWEEKGRMRFESHQEKRYARAQKEGQTPDLKQPPVQGFNPTSSTALFNSQVITDPAFSTSLLTPPLSVIAYNRIAFGPRPGDIEAFDALGADDDSRLTAFVDQQLDPDSIDDSALDARLNTPDYSTLSKSLTELWTQHQLSSEWSTRIRPVKETAYAAYLRATHSERQLVEVLADFWHNHFSVYGWEDPANSVWVHYDRDVIRPHMLGNFRNMLEANAKSPAMLAYLDNFVSSGENPNENYARELLELHTLGSLNYFGSADPASVPKDANGVAIGYVEADVKAVARCLTGWSFRMWGDTPSNGEFVYRSSWHDDSEKQVLGQTFPPAQGDLVDGNQVLDLLAAHPGTAKSICQKLCRRFISDHPPESIVTSAAQVFQSHWQQPDQLKRVMRHILLSAEFRNTWGEKVKRPFETAVSAMRALRFDFALRINTDTSVWTASDQLEWVFQNSGQFPFTWAPPNGFPDKRATWQGSTPLVMGWRTANHLLEGPYQLEGEVDRTGLYTPVLADTLAAFPNPALRTPNNLASYWFERVLGYSPDAQQVSHVAAILDHSKHSPDQQDLDQPIDLGSNEWPTYWQSGLRAMVGLILMSPEFLQR